ncbi:hypothetical protein [Streptomyces sp. NPDC048516]|uniref:hypothetical protein n=1 Tax=Streptomyces sp. NPDC048516 TaxID=3365565 RepID=UPI003714C8E5
MQEQGTTAAWCGRLLLFTAPPAAPATPQTPGHPVTGHPVAGYPVAGYGGHAGLGGPWPISGPPRPALPA